MMDLERFKSGDRAYHGALATKYGNLVLGITLAYTRDVEWAQDLFQEIWIRVLKKRNTFKAHGSFRGWLHRLATNYCKNAVKAKDIQNQAMEEVELQYLIDLEVSASEMAQLTETRERWRAARLRCLHAALSQLPNRQYEAIRLRNLQRLPTAVVAERMGVTSATVRSLVRHGLRRLKRLMEGTEDELPRA
jgi:RNA polymerase sigma-70 factor (ECF subfamily)